MAPSPAGRLWLAYMVLAAASVIPLGVLGAMARRREERIRRGVPDAVDLRLVCVEAGSSVESAIQRVAREVAPVHPELARELAVAVRETNAGISRAEALRGLYARTRVDELRMIGARILQSERWGTSVADALRASAETVRRKRERAAERRASTAPMQAGIGIMLLSAIGYQLSVALMAALRAVYW
jgi:tight adherence protein C